MLRGDARMILEAKSVLFVPDLVTMALPSVPWLWNYSPVPDHSDSIPDVRDGLTREERVVLFVLHQAQKERGDRNVPTAMLWGRVCEHFYISPEELSEMLARLGARR